MKKMNKKKGIILFIIGIIVAAGLGFLTIFGAGSEHKGKASHIIQGLDLKGGVSITYEVVNEKFTNEEFKDTINKLENRAYEFSDESTVYAEGDNRITVEIPDQSDAAAVLESLGKPGSLQFVTDYGTENEKVWIEGTDVAEAEGRAQKNQTTGNPEYVVALKFTANGREQFAQATDQFLGQPIYIIYDGQCISAPTVQAKITNGEAVITGQDTLESAEQLASMIRIGSLKLELTDISSKVVGAKLGDDAIRTSLTAGFIGIIIVIIFMLAAYRVPGLAAGIALIIYVILDLLALNGFDITLTLPGIAGVILSIGMAVDANVIIFTRIKEELVTSSDVRLAIKNGFNKATSAIVDGNVTTLIAAFVLMWKGTGPIQGFAKTLAIGIIISMFTALVVTRFFAYMFYYMGFNKVGMYGVQKEAKKINFVGKKGILFSVSGILIAVGIVFLVCNKAGAFTERDTAFNYSVEFKGGVTTEVEFNKNYSISEFNKEILPKIQKIAGDGDITANEVSGTNQYVIKSKRLDETVQNEIRKMLVSDYGAIEKSFTETSVGASVSNEMRDNAIVAVALSVLCMLIYIFIRFRDMKFAFSAVLALVHDVAIVVLFYAVSWTTVGNTFIACLLTILGYSINATIVIFDRIRENIAIEGKRTDIKEIVNKSINQTLTRSIYTSLTTFVMVAALYVLGVTSMKEFALPLMVGIVAGAYSSVCITGSLWYIMAKKKYSKNTLKEATDKK